MAMVLAMEFKFGRSRKRITARNVLTLIAFSQNLVQGMWYDDDPFLQLPYMNYDRLKEVRRKYKNIPFEIYCLMPKEERLKLAIFDND